MAEIIEIPVQGGTPAPQVNTPASSTGIQEIPVQTVLPPADKAGNGIGMTILYIVLALMLLGSLLYLLYFSKKGTGEKLKLGGGGGGGRKQQGNGQSSQTAQPQIQYVVANSSAPTNSNAVAYMNSENAEARKVQQNLNDTCAKKYGFSPLVVDGAIGTNSLTAIAKIGSKGAEIAQAIRATGYITRAQMDWLLVPCESAEIGEALTSDKELIDTKAFDMTRKQLVNYIASKGISFTESSWYLEGLRQWVEALKKGNKSFMCSECWTKGMYSTATGKPL